MKKDAVGCGLWAVCALLGLISEGGNEIRSWPRRYRHSVSR